eukprot:827700-Amorphochlora_amoeboformis.AAC.1
MKFSSRARRAPRKSLIVFERAEKEEGVQGNDGEWEEIQAVASLSSRVLEAFILALICVLGTDYKHMWMFAFGMGAIWG